MLKDSKGTMTPEEVMWKLYQERNTITIPKENPQVYRNPSPKVNLRELFRRR